MEKKAIAAKQNNHKKTKLQISKAKMKKKTVK